MICHYCATHTPAHIAAHGGCQSPDCSAAHRRKALAEASEAQLHDSPRESPRYAYETPFRGRPS